MKDSFQSREETYIPLRLRQEGVVQNTQSYLLWWPPLNKGRAQCSLCEIMKFIFYFQKEDPACIEFYVA